MQPQQEERLRCLLREADLTCAVNLPISKAKEEIIRSIRENQVIVVTGDTGSGKTTQIPKLCLAVGRGVAGRIVCTQPRRIAAITVSSRLSEELGPAGPELVGYRVRFRDRTGPLTRVHFVTDGILITELSIDPFLSTYDTVIVDEAHERSLNIDVLVGNLRRILPRRPDLKVIITSATIDTEKFSQAFGGAPVVSVGGSSFPVRIRYRPPQVDVDTVDHVVSEVEGIRREDPIGDILIFLPTERLIQETAKTLSTAFGNDVLVLPLYGRLSSTDQGRIFKPAHRQKIVVATNVAETSITVPGIRYVVDSGLARMSCHNPRTRTTALPIAPISRASADQRAGRAGRVSPGVCVRLYSEEDYLGRDLFTSPEILRSNLSGVLLRLLALGIDRVEEFPFIDPPSPHAIKEGLATLRELGALNDEKGLTRIGRLMARFPLDPRISRMVIQAREEKAVREVAIIAAALSIQDPRERPAGRETQADQAHRTFQDSGSDFLTFLRIWNAFEAESAQGRSRAEMRRFCEARFLSYQRMCEWKDVTDQILSILGGVGGFAVNKDPAGPDAINRSILSGFLGNIAQHQENTRYTGTSGREIHIHPGSALFRTHPRWIVSAEIARTTRLYARICSGVRPEWIEELAGPLAKSEFFEPHWEKDRGEVIAYERVRVFGLLVVEKRKVSYGRISPGECREIFIRDGLIPGNLRHFPPLVRKNIETIREVEELGTRFRDRSVHVDKTWIFSRYEESLTRLEEETGSAPILDERSFLRAMKKAEDPSYFSIHADELLENPPSPSELALFPGHITVQGHEIPLRYRFQPGDAEDGVTAVISLSLLDALDPGPFEWLVPGLLLRKVTELLKNLPKGARKKLYPLSETAEKICQNLTPCNRRLTEALEEFLHRELGIGPEETVWPHAHVLPLHVLMRFELVDDRGQVLAHGRDLEALKKSWGDASKNSLASDPAWTAVRARWESGGHTLSTLPDLPDPIPFVPGPGMGKRIAFPGYEQEGKTVSIRLFLDQDRADTSTRDALAYLLTEELQTELAYIRKRAVPPGLPPEILMSLGGTHGLGERITSMIQRVFILSGDVPKDRKGLISRAEDLKKDLYQRSIAILHAIAACAHAAAETRKAISRLTHGGRVTPARTRLAEDLSREFVRLLPEDFPASTDPENLPHLPRYLKALAVRAGRAALDPAKDAAKAARIEPYVEAISRISPLNEGSDSASRAARENYLRLLEEFRVSVFAPELGTSVPVSAKRLDEALRAVCFPY